MLTFIKDDILGVSGDLLVNAANAKGYMGGLIGRVIRFPGVAETIHYAAPRIEKQAKQICKRHRPTPGDVFHTSASALPYEKGILHAVTMKQPGQRSHIDTIESCIINMLTYCDTHQIKTAVLPLLGCGVGRIPKQDVIKLYNKYLLPHPTLFIVVNNK